VTVPVGTPLSPELLGEGNQLVVPSSRLGVPLPAYAGRSLPNLASSLSAVIGGSKQEDLPLPPLDTDLDPWHGRRPEGPVVVLLVDGLGWTALRSSAARLPDGPAARWASGARAMTSVFPTTTTIALTSLSSGASPGQHGVVGHRVYLPRHDAVVELLRMSPLGVAAAETLVGPDWSPGSVSGVPTIFRRGTPAVALTRERYEGSGFTRLIYDGAAFATYITASDFATRLTGLLNRPNPPSLVFAYWDELDVTQHVRGPLPEIVDHEIDGVASILAHVARHLEPDRARRTTVVVTGDHGQVPMSADQQLVADRDPELLSLLARPPSGDRRATFFSAQPGRRSELRAALEARRPPGAHLLDQRDAVEGGLYGPEPYHPELTDRLGDFLLMMPSPGGVSYTVPGSRPRGHPMMGAHGGLEPEELLVPLIAGSLADLAEARSSPRVHLRGPDSERA
jgi:hypothetical protein